MPQVSISAGVRTNLSRISTGRDASIGVNAKRLLTQIGTRGANDAIWNEGDSCVIPASDVLDQSLFVQRFGSNSAAGVVLEDQNNRGKNFYFSSVTKTMPIYKATDNPNSPFEATGEIEDANSVAAGIEDAQKVRDTYDLFNNCGTANDQLQVLANNAGKTLKCVKRKKVTTARYDSDGNISGTRNTFVCAFVIE